MTKEKTKIYVACFARKFTREAVSDIVEVEANSIYDVADKMIERFPQFAEPLKKGSEYVDID